LGYVTLAFVYDIETKKVTLIDMDGEDLGFVWQSAGKLHAGAIGGDPWVWDGATAAVWKRKTSKKTVSYELHLVPSLTGYTGMIAVGINQEDEVVGSAVDKDGAVRAWYAVFPDDECDD
jgi:hypothetical protein